MNALWSALLSNYEIAGSFLFGELFVTGQVYGNCSCDRKDKCITEVIVRSDSFSSVSWILPGFYVGCYILEALLQSHLGCFFNQTCLNTFHSRLLYGIPLDITVLDSSVINKFTPETTVGAILDELMVESWNSSVVYANYFATCQPKECTYTVMERNDVIYIVTTVFGLIGGLVTVLKLVIPRIVYLIMYVVEPRRQNRVISMTIRETKNVHNDH